MFNWFCRIYCKKDLVIYTIILVAIYVAFIPFDIWAYQFAVDCNSYTFIILTIPTQVILTTVYIVAVVKWGLWCKRMKMMKALNQLPPEHIDPIWLDKDSR